MLGRGVWVAPWTWHGRIVYAAVSAAGELVASEVLASAADADAVAARLWALLSLADGDVPAEAGPPASDQEASRVPARGHLRLIR